MGKAIGIIATSVVLGPTAGSVLASVEANAEQQKALKDQSRQADLAAQAESTQQRFKLVDILSSNLVGEGAAGVRSGGALSSANIRRGNLDIAQVAANNEIVQRGIRQRRTASKIQTAARISSSLFNFINTLQ